MQRAIPQAMMLIALVAGSVSAQSNIDPAKSFAWTENGGWTNWRDADNGIDGVDVTATYLVGYIWSENVGWIVTGPGAPANGVHYANKDSLGFGVNIESDTGRLSGFAWGENIGWINFDTATLGDNCARFDLCARRFFGYAWSENVGWINLGDAGVFIAVGPCTPGDADCDGSILLDDYEAFVSEFGGPGSPVDCPAFDWDGDGDVDLFDFARLQAAYART
jgi:hypothetical protein